MIELKLEGISRARNSLHFTFAISDLRFATTYWYDSVDFSELEARFGVDPLRRLYFHIAAFEINKLASLKPDVIDFGPYAVHQTAAFEQLWRIIFRNVWAQWRYENDLPCYEGPALRESAASPPSAPCAGAAGPVEILNFCGGGKDSLVSMKLLERGGLPFDSLVYSSSIYGTAARQHALIRELLAHGAAKTQRRQWIFDDFLDSPVLELRADFRAKTLTAAETPSSVFAALPLVLQHGYRHIALGHERSADTGQVIWQKTGEDVNHQWGKSFEAEMLINQYINQHLIEGCSFFSILKPIYDVLIFSMLRRDLDAVPATHSCNIEKPWCRRCPKCAYVWLGYMAFLPRETVVNTFGNENLLDVPENHGIYRQLLGLEDQLPFECVGQRDEVKLCFEMCRRKGVVGAAMRTFECEAGTVNLNSLMKKYLSVDWGVSAVPSHIQAHIREQLTLAVDEARAYIQGL